ncbi:NUDIX hydrolase [Mariniluteicoccus endophyticus]
MTPLTQACRAELEAWEPADELQGGLRRTFLRHLDDTYEGWSRDCPGAHLTGSAIVVSPDAGRVLLVMHKRLGRWLQTGGHVEADDADLGAAALREAREESGLRTLELVPGILQLDRHEVPCGTVRPTFHLDVRYLAIGDPVEEPVVSDESEEVRWFDADALPETDESVTSLVQEARLRLRG